MGGGRVGGGGVDVIEELKFLGKCTKKILGGQGGCEQRIKVFVIFFFFGGGGVGGGGVGSGEGGSGWLGGQGGCE